MINTVIKNKLMTYVQTLISADPTFGSYDLYGPNIEDPDLESTDDDIITIDIDEYNNEQFALGSRTTRKTGAVVVTLFVKAGTGINLISEFKGFMDSIGLAQSDNVTYKEPVEVMTPAEYKGWEPTSISLPFQVENYDV